jgi:hypothetical protein
VTRRDLEGITTHHLQRGAISHLDVQMPGQDVAEVVHLAALGTDDRLDMVRPAPAWLEYRPSYGQLSQLDQFDSSPLDYPDLVRSIEPLMAQLHGTDGTNRC